MPCLAVPAPRRQALTLLSRRACQEGVQLLPRRRDSQGKGGALRAPFARARVLGCARARQCPAALGQSAVTARPLRVCSDCAPLTLHADQRRHPLDPGDGPLKLAYSSAHCLDFKRHKSCRRGNACPYSHGCVHVRCAGSPDSCTRVLGALSGVCSANVNARLTCGARSAWEVGLHPSSYRSQMCTYGASCNRRMCFFAHDPSQLRVEAAMKYIDMEQAQFGISELWRPEGRARLSLAS
jgi:hypothetical protein